MGRRMKFFSCAALLWGLFLVSGVHISSQIARAANSSVSIQNYHFSPGALTVSAGTTVTWTNSDGALHEPSGPGFDVGPLGKGEQGSFTFDSPGTFSYICKIHQSMHGSIVVQHSATATSVPATSTVIATLDPTSTPTVAPATLQPLPTVSPTDTPTVTVIPASSTPSPTLTPTFTPGPRQDASATPTIASTSTPTPVSAPTEYGDLTPTPTTTPSDITTATASSTPLPDEFRATVRGTLQARHVSTLVVTLHDSLNNNPVDAATVTLDGHRVGLRHLLRATSSSQGRVVFKRLHPTRAGSISLVIRKAGLTSRTVKVRVRA